VAEAQIDIDELIGSTLVEPRPYQSRLITKAVHSFKVKNCRSVLIESPTGAGKTIIALLIAKIMQECFGASIGWAAMRRNLLVQAAKENKEKGINADIHFISMFDKRPPVGLDFLVVDEAQHDATMSMCNIHGQVKPKWTLGLSATPYRVDRVKLCFDAVLKDAGIHRLIQDGYLSPYDHYTIPAWSVQTVVDFYLGDRERWGKSIIYFRTLQECWKAWHFLNEGGVPCDVVSGNLKCDNQLEDFHSGKTMVLLNCLKLTEGFDAPSLKTVFARPSSKAVAVQMCGRVFRKHPSIPVKQIVQPADTKWPFPLTASPLAQHTYVDGVWRSIKPNDTMEQVAAKMLIAVATSTSGNMSDKMRQRISSGSKRLGRIRFNRDGSTRRVGSDNRGNEIPESGIRDRDESEMGGYRDILLR